LAKCAYALSPISANAYVTKGAYTYCDGPCSGNGNDYYNNDYDNGNGNFNPNVLDKNSVPTVYRTDPEETGTNDNLKSITIYGTGFKPDSIARWNSIDRPTTFVSANKLVMRLDPEDTATAGKYQVSVVNPSPEGGRFSNQKVVNVIKGKVLGTVAGVSTKASGATSGGYTTNTTSSKNTTTVAKSKTTKSTTKVASSTDTKAKVAAANEKLKGNLAAAVINGDNSMMPNSVIEWLVLFALILFSVLLFRKLWLTPADHAKPLKHA
jgi:hypothetical protein